MNGIVKTATVSALMVTAACSAAGARIPSARTAFAEVDSTAASTIAPGVTHTFVRDGRGPWAVHIVEIDAAQCVPDLEVRKPGSSLAARATTTAIAAGALVAINADFFMLPAGTPVGAHVTGGVPLTGPVSRPVFAVTDAGWRIGTARMAGHARTDSDSAAIAQVNRPSATSSSYRGTTDGLTLFTPWIGDSVTVDSAALRLTLRLISGNEAAGAGIVTASSTAFTGTAMHDGSIVMLAHGSARAWASRRAPGDTVRWTARVGMAAEPAVGASASPGGDVLEHMGSATAVEAVGGFPELLRGGRDVLGDQTVGEAFGGRRHPRTAIGWTADRRLLLVVVDGRQPGHSEGMTLPELTWLFRRLGATDALNLDGGGSTAMVVQGRLVNRTSDREGERAIGNALVVTGCS